MLKQALAGFARSARDIVSGRNLAWHLVAIVSTFVLVTIGFDWWFYLETRSAILHPIVWAAGIGGFFLPVVVPLVLYIVGAIRKDTVLKQKAIAVFEAVILASILAIIYKTFTGRVPPEFITAIGNSDISRQFQFGFLRGGIFWGWPSSHTAVAVAGGVTMLRLFKSFPIRTLAVLYMVIVAVGAAIGFHWFSDVVAGVIFGILIGNILAKQHYSRS